MPTITSNCNYPHCGLPSTSGKYCDKHKRISREESERVRLRNSPSVQDRKQFYNSVQWRSISKWFRRKNPLCAVCGKIAHHVDHIVPLADGGHATSEENLQSLCVSCHTKKTIVEQARRL